ncbi:MAG: hypothetical protein H7A36_03975 [Chlamydiales bacterium]|nr:hypothetical protein [Chlamydiales bacterium]
MKKKGFIYKHEGEWVLAEEPNLKTCCLRKESLLILEGDFSKTTPFQAYTVKGTLSEGRLVDAHVTEGGSFPLVSLLVLVLIAIPYFKKKFKPS